MLDTIKALIPEDSDMPARSREIHIRELFRTGEIYDVKDSGGQPALREFHEERNSNDDYVPLHKRKPSVRYGLAAIIVNDTTSLLFGDDHFPAFEIKKIEKRLGKKPKRRKPGAEPSVAEVEADAFGEQIDDVLQDLKKEIRLQQIMLEGAVIGSAGSVCFTFRVLKGRIFVKPVSTKDLTPEWDPEEPDKLLRVVEKYKVRGAALRAMGYVVEEKDLNRQFWFQRIWDRQREIWFIPWPVLRQKGDELTAYPEGPTEDASRTISHSLGFVPMVWAKNLPGGDDIDGECTFRLGMQNALEIDYQISQGGRGLKYSSDPTLHIRDPGYESIGAGTPIVKGGDNALVTGPDSEVKLLEISGTASKAVEDYARFVREITLELCGGNRTTPEKLSGAQSGKAMELMNQGLIWVTKRLRTSYGDGALVDILKMVLDANQVFPLRIGGIQYDKGDLPASSKVSVNLVWPAWYPPTAADDANEATAIKTNREAGVLSRETAVRKLASRYDIEDPMEEIDRIDHDLQLDADREIETQTAIKPPASPKLAKDAA